MAKVIESVNEVSKRKKSEELVELEEVRLLFDDLLADQSSWVDQQSRLDTTEKLSNSLRMHLNKDNESNYIIKRLVRGCCTIRNGVNLLFAETLHRLFEIDPEREDYLDMEMVEGILKKEIEVQKLVKQVAVSNDDIHKFKGCILVLTILAKTRNHVCVNLLSTLYRYFHKNRALLNGRLCFAFDWLFYSSLTIIKKTDYQTNFLDIFTANFTLASKSSPPLPLHLCLEMTVIARRFPKLSKKVLQSIASDQTISEVSFVWNLLDNISIADFVAFVDKSYPHKPALIYAFVDLYKFGSEAFRLLWDHLLKSTDKRDRQLVWFLLQNCGELSSCEQVIKLFSQSFLEFIEGSGKGFNKQRHSYFINSFIEGLDPTFYYKLLVHLIENYSSISVNLSTGNLFLSMFTKLEQKEKLEILKKIENKVLGSEKDFDKCFDVFVAVLNKVLRNYPLSEDKEVHDTICRVFLKFTLLKHPASSSEAAASPMGLLKENTLFAISSSLKNEIMNADNNLIALFIEVVRGTTNKDCFKNAKFTKKCCQLIESKDESYSFAKQILLILCCEVSLIHSKPQAEIAMQILDKFVQNNSKDDSGCQSQFKRLLTFLVSVMENTTLGSSQFNSLIFLSLKTFVTTSELKMSKTLINEMFEYYDHLLVQLAEKSDKDNSEGEGEDENSSDEESESEESDNDESHEDEEDNEKLLEVQKIAESKGLGVDENCFDVDLDEGCDETVESELKQFDEKFQNILQSVMPRSSDDTHKNEKAPICLITLIQFLFRFEMKSKFLKYTLVKCLQITASESCSDDSRRKFLDVFLSHNFEKDLAGKIIEVLESEECTSMCKLLIDTIRFHDFNSIRLWKLVVKFFCSIYNHDNEEGKATIKEYCANYLSDWLNKGGKDNIQPFMTHLFDADKLIFWSFVQSAFYKAKEDDLETTKDKVSSCAIGMMNILTPEVLKQIPTTDHTISQFVMDVCRKVLQQSVKLQCKKADRNAFLQFAVIASYKMEAVRSCVKLKKRVEKTLAAYENSEAVKDQKCLNFLRSIALSFKVDSVSFLTQTHKTKREMKAEKRKKAEENGQVEKKKAKKKVNQKNKDIESVNKKKNDEVEKNEKTKGKEITSGKDLKRKPEMETTAEVKFIKTEKSPKRIKFDDE